MQNRVLLILKPFRKVYEGHFRVLGSFGYVNMGMEGTTSLLRDKF